MSQHLRRLVLAVAVLVTLTALLFRLGGLPLHPASISSLTENRSLATVLAILWWFAVAWSIPILGDFTVWRNLKHADLTQQRKLVGDLVGIAAYFAAGCAIIAFVFDFPVNTVFATSGVVAIVIGLALQNTLSDVFSGIALNLEHPYRIGDWVSIGPEAAGKVVETNWRSTHIQLGSRDILIVPNNVIAKYRIINYHRPGLQHRVAVLISVAESDQPGDVREVLKSAALSAAGVLDDPAPKVQIVTFNDNSITYSLEFFVNGYASADDTRTAVLAEVWAHMAWAGLKRPQLRHSIDVARAKSKEDGDTSVALAHLVGKIHVFDSLSGLERSLLAKSLVRRTFRRDDVVVNQGDAGQSLFVIGVGVLEVVSALPGGDSRAVARLGAGQYFGEMSLLTGAPRSASIISVTDSVVYELDHAAFEPFVLARPAMVEDLGRILSARSVGLAQWQTQQEQIPSASALSAITQRIATFFSGAGRSSRRT